VAAITFIDFVVNVLTTYIWYAFMCAHVLRKYIFFINLLN